MIRTSGRGGWVGGGVMVGGLELYKLGIFIYIYIYISETPSWFQSSDEESVRCNGMTGCRGGRGVILASSVVSSFCSAALQFLSGLLLPPPLMDTVWLFW